MASILAPGLHPVVDLKSLAHRGTLNGYGQNRVIDTDTIRCKGHRDSIDIVHIHDTQRREDPSIQLAIRQTSSSPREPRLPVMRGESTRHATANATRPVGTPLGQGPTGLARQLFVLRTYIIDESLVTPVFRVVIDVEAGGRTDWARGRLSDKPRRMRGLRDDRGRRRRGQDP